MAGDGLVLASLLLSAAVTVAQSRLLTGRDPVAVTAVQFLGAAVGALLVTVFMEGAPAVPGSPGPVLAVLALTVGGTVLPFTLFAFGQSRVSAEVAGAFLNLEPLVGAIVGAAAFGDPVGLAQVAGGAAIVAGIGLSSLPLLAGRRRPQADAEPLVLDDAEAPALAGLRSLGYGCDSLPDRGSTLPQPGHTLAHPGRRNGVFVVVYAGKFGAGGPGGARPGPGPGRAGARPRGPGAGRPPARGRGANPGTGPGASGRRPRGDRGRSWPGAGTGRSAAGR